MVQMVRFESIAGIGIPGIEVNESTSWAQVKKPILKYMKCSRMKYELWGFHQKRKLRNLDEIHELDIIRVIPKVIPRPIFKIGDEVLIGHVYSGRRNEAPIIEIRASYRPWIAARWSRLRRVYRCLFAPSIYHPENRKHFEVRKL